MEIINISFNNYRNINISIDLLFFVVLMIIVILLIMLCKFIFNRKCLKTVCINEADIGIGNTTIKIKYDKRIQEIAYKMWIELKSRKVAIVFDEDNDVIDEVYNSWYETFKIIRSLLKEIPLDRINDSKELSNLTLRILNDGLRPHLTKWQAKYRKWYELNKDNYKELAPQKIQKKYPEYDELVSDLIETNRIIVNYANELEKIAFEYD